MKHIAIAALLIAVTASAAFAAATGVLRGRVSDAGGHPLPKATVRVDPGATSIATDQEGAFALPLVAGAYRVQIGYVGFVTVAQDVTVGGAPVTLDVKLDVAPEVSESVTVSASRERGQVEALNERKDAPNIVDILPQETIASLPNANIAEALARLPSVSVERDEGEPKFVQVRGLEPRFTSVTINGVRIPSDQSDVRQIKLDAFPSDLVQSLELNKTVSADQEGDAIGGAVNIVTPLASDTSRLTAVAEGGYTTLQGGRPRSRFDGTWSNRFGDDHAVGLIVGATYDYNGRAINDIEPGPGVVSLPNGTNVNAFTGADYRDYRYERRRFGATEGLDYRLSDTSNLFLRGLFAEFHNYGDRWVRSASVGNFLTPALTDDSGGFSENVQHRTPNEQTYSIVAGGNRLLATSLVDYEFSYSHARQDSTNYTTASFDGPSAAFGVDSSNGYFPKLVPLNGVTGLDPSQYTLSGIQFSSGDTWTPSWAAAANYTMPFDRWDLKTGIRYRDDTKHNTAFSRYYNADGSLTMDKVMSSFGDPNYYFNFVPEGPNPSLSAILRYFASAPGAFTENINKEHLRNDPNNFTASEKVGGAYAKSMIRFGNAFLDAGVRVEHTASSYDAFTVLTGSNGRWQSTSPTSASHSYTNLLPSVSVRYAIDTQTNLRAAYGWTVGRPDYADLVPSIVISDQRNQVAVGNPNLKPTRAQNYDLLFEHFFSSVGVVSGGAFYKDLRNPIYPGATSIIRGGTYDGFTQVQAINGPKATIRGYEVGWQQQFGFLPGLLSGLGVDANYTRTTSKATFDPSTGRTGTAPLQRTAPNTANFGLTYDKGPVTFRAAATYNSASIFFYNYTDGADGGLRGPNGDTYLYPHMQIDAQISYALGRGLQLFVNGLNLNNEVFGFYNGSPQWNIQREFYSRTYSAGVRVVR